MFERMSRAERKAQIVALLKQQKGAVTTYRLAKLAGVAPSTKYMQLVLEAWREGMIGGYAYELRNGITAYYWHDTKKEFAVQKALGI